MPRPDPRFRDAIVSYLKRNYPEMCRHWFDEIEPVRLDSGMLKLLVREQVQLKYLQRCCVKQFTEAAQEATGRLVTVRFVGEAELAEEQCDTDGRVPAPAHAGSPATEEHMLISPDYSFENFITGPGNRLAHAAAVAVAQKPGRAYNPLFLHGGVGLGKTHLLQAVCQAAMGHTPHLRVYYTSCNGFMNQFLAAVQDGHMVDFRHHFRGVDLLLIDDIHDLSNRDRTQEEFFHTFNSLHQAGKQIVLSSDAPPSRIPDLEERLTSRFNCGLVAEIEKPCYETRVAIVQKKAGMRGVDLPEDVASYIAAKVDSNIRELEGAIVKLQGLSMTDHEPIDLQMAKQAIGEQTGQSVSHPSIQNIIDAVTGYYDVKLTDLLSKRRHKSIALPRQVAMWLARRHTRYSLEEIGGYFGGRDHTTVMHAIRTIDKRRNGDPSLDHDVTRLEDQVMTIGGGR